MLPGSRFANQKTLVTSGSACLDSSHVFPTARRQIQLTTSISRKTPKAEIIQNTFGRKQLTPCAQTSLVHSNSTAGAHASAARKAAGLQRTSLAIPSPPTTGGWSV